MFISICLNDVLVCFFLFRYFSYWLPAKEDKNLTLITWLLPSQTPQPLLKESYYTFIWTTISTCYSLSLSLTMFSTMIIFPLLENIVYLILYLITPSLKNLPMNSFITQLQTVQSDTDSRGALLLQIFWRHFSHSLWEMPQTLALHPHVGTDFAPHSSGLEPMPFYFHSGSLLIEQLFQCLWERVLKRLLFWADLHIWNIFIWPLCLLNSLGIWFSIKEYFPHNLKGINSQLPVLLLRCLMLFWFSVTCMKIFLSWKFPVSFLALSVLKFQEDESCR